MRLASYSHAKDQNNTLKLIKKMRTDFRNMNPADVAFPRTCNNVGKYRSHMTIYQKGTPIHVRGSLLFNHYVKEKNTNHNKQMEI